MTTESKQSEAPSSDALAQDGGPKAFPSVEATPEPKIGVAEFLSIAERFGFKPEALERLRHTVSDADLQGNGPNFARYACPFPKETKGDAMEALAREQFGVAHARGVSSGTGALHAAMIAAGVGPDKEVIVPAVGFIATAMAVVAAGGRPVFCDIDDSMLMAPDQLESLITPATVAVAPTHWAGHVCDMDAITHVARKHDLFVIEDCAQAPGASFNGAPVGTIGHIGCFSISAYKIIGGGEGGMIITNDTALAERADQLIEAGGLWRPVRFAEPRYDNELFPGVNYRLSELEAAIDTVQLDKLPHIVERYRHNHARVRRQLQTFPHVTPRRSNDPDGDIGMEMRFYPRDVELGQRLLTALKAEGVGAAMRGPDAAFDWHYYAHMLPLTESRTADRIGRGDCPVADDLFERSIRVSVNQWYTEADCDHLAQALNKVFTAIQ